MKHDEQIEQNETEEDSEVAQDIISYRQACYNTFLSVEIETIKQLIFLSSGGVGLLATFFLSSRFDNGYVPLWFIAVAFFLAVIIINLVLFSKASNIIKNELLYLDNKKNNKLVVVLELAGKILFPLAMLFTVSFAASTKF
jgi:hypothetical protein